MLAIVLISEAASARRQGEKNLRERQRINPKDRRSGINSTKTKLIHANLPAALDALQRAAKILSNSKKKVPSWIWNNIGALRFNVGVVNGVEVAYKAARKVAETDEDITTTEYNLALFYAHRGEYTNAIELHKTILKKHPLFIESMLSMGSINEQAGRFEEAQQWYEKAQDAAKDEIFKEKNFGREERDVHLLVTDPSIKLGNLFYRLARKNRSQLYMTRALEVFRSVSQTDREDAYSRIAMGTLEYERLPDPYRTGKIQDDYTYVQRFQASRDWFQRVLMREPSNLYAAHGLGVLLFEQMKLDDAKRVFQTLKEHYPRHVGAWINLGHVYMMQNRPVRIFVFISARRFENNT